MTTHYRGVGCTGEDRVLNSHIEDTRNTNDNENTNSSETMIAFRGSEADGHLSDLLPNSQADLKILTREIHSLQQCIEAREGQPVEGLDCIDHLEQELQTVTLTLSMQPTSTPTPTEPYGEVVCQYTDTLCTTQKQTHLTNSLLQDIAFFKEHDSLKLEEWLTNIETAADLTSENQAKLAKANSQGLTHMLVMDDIDSKETWDDIKDLLKLCNANIHTYTSWRYNSR